MLFIETDSKMQRVISYHAAEDAEGGDSQPQEFNTNISKRTCISLGLSLSFFTMIIGTLKTLITILEEIIIFSYFFSFFFTNIKQI